MSTRDLATGELTDAVADLLRRRIGIIREQDEHLRPGRIRRVDARGGADEAVLRLGDDERQPNAHDPCSLAEDHLDPARILLVAGDLPRPVRRLDAGESDDPAFGLRDDLLREHDHVAVLELDLRDDELGKVVPFLDLRQSGDRDDAKLAAQGSPVRRMPACAL